MKDPCPGGGEEGRSTTGSRRQNGPGWGSRVGDRDGRAVVPVLAMTILIGLVVVASVSIMMVGTDAIETTSKQSEVDRVESGFVEFGEGSNTVALSSTQSREVAMDLQGTDGAVTRENTGRIEISVSGRSDPVVNETIDSIEYRNDDTIIAYQAGGVWRGTGNGSRMVSAPEVHYRNGTLTFPVMSVSGDETLSGDTIRVEKNRTIAPLNDVSIVEGDLVTITVQSEYYVGWAEYFETRTGDTAVTVDHENETVVVNLGRPTIGGDFENSVVAQGSVETSGNGCIDGEIVASGDVDGEACDGSDLDGGDEDVSLQPIDEAINMTVDAAESDGQPLGNGTNTIDNGTYYSDELHLDGETLTIDVSNGDVVVGVDGHVSLENADIEVVGTSGSDGVARIYSTGDVAIGGGNGGVTVDDGDPSRFQLYGTSEMHFALGQGEFTGTVYAPREEPANGSNEAADGLIPSSNNCDLIDGDPPDVCLGQGNVDFTGSIIAGTMSIEQSSTLTYDTRLEDAEPSLALDGVVLPPRLTHLHVVVHEVEVTDA